MRPAGSRCCPPAPLPASRGTGAPAEREEPTGSREARSARSLAVSLAAVHPQQGGTVLRSVPVVWEALQEPTVTSGGKPCCGDKQLLMPLYFVGWTASRPYVPIRLTQTKESKNHI